MSSQIQQPLGRLHSRGGKAMVWLWAAVVALTLGGCRGGKDVALHDDWGVYDHTVKPVQPRTGDKIKGSAAGKRIVAEAMTWLGTPYRYAAQEKGSGTDCSGMVMQVYLHTTGLKLPRNSAKQAEYCRELKASEVEAGDLVFFATGKDPNRVSHVGIMIGPGEFIHASSKRGVTVSRMEGSYYPQHFLMYGRVPELRASHNQ